MWQLHCDIFQVSDLHHEFLLVCFAISLMSWVARGIVMVSK